jgi:YbbR domain-containing protein
MRRILLNNLGLKLLALAFATALWLLVVGEQEEEVGFIVPLGFKGIRGDMVMVSNPPGDVEVRVAGPKAFIRNLSPAKITADVDLSNAREGLNTLRLKPHDIRMPRGIEVTSIRPSTIDVWMEHLFPVKVPVKVRVEGRPDKGYKVASITVEPSEVEVFGTRKEIKDIKRVYTTPVAINGLAVSKSETVFLEISKKGFSSIKPDTVLVTVELEEKARGKKSAPRGTSKKKGGR